MYGNNYGTYSQYFFVLAEVKKEDRVWQFEDKLIISEIGCI